MPDRLLAATRPACRPRSPPSPSAPPSSSGTSPSTAPCGAPTRPPPSSRGASSGWCATSAPSRTSLGDGVKKVYESELKPMKKLRRVKGVVAEAEAAAEGPDTTGPTASRQQSDGPTEPRSEPTRTRRGPRPGKKAGRHPRLRREPVQLLNVLEWAHAAAVIAAAPGSAKPARRRPPRTIPGLTVVVLSPHDPMTRGQLRRMAELARDEGLAVRWQEARGGAGRAAQDDRCRSRASCGGRTGSSSATRSRATCSCCSR